MKRKTWDALIVGGGLAGLSAALYLARAQNSVLVIDSGKSMARWEPDVQNYLGFPTGISGKELLKRGRAQARRYGARFTEDCVVKAKILHGTFQLRGKKNSYHGKFLLLATGIFHLPPEINGVSACLGHSMFFCKDCDGVRARAKRIAIYGATDEAVEYALAMLRYSSQVVIVTNGKRPRWSKANSQRLSDYEIPVHAERIELAACRGRQVRSLKFANSNELRIDALFTTRGDIYFNDLAKMLRAKITDGEIVVDAGMRTSVKRLYAAGCVTPANCQMIIAAGQGAAAAQSINRELFRQSLADHSLVPVS